MEMDKSDSKIDMLLGKKENPALAKVLGKKKFDENTVLGKTVKDGALDKMMGKTYEKELTDKTVKCPKCGHEFNPEA